MTDQTLLQKAQAWTDPNIFDLETCTQVQRLLDSNDEATLQDCFGSSLSFGTGGLRGIMGVGTNRMNLYTVQQATEGLARYIDQEVGDGEKSVVIGFDSRHQSKEFAQAAGDVLMAHQIKVYLYQELCPTPQVSNAILRLKATAGIIITASHNPPNYNGYKVYWRHGGQVVPPEDHAIIEKVASVASIGEIPKVTSEAAATYCQWLTEDDDFAYISDVKPYLEGSTDGHAELGVIYTPLHGTGGRLVPRLLEERGFTKQRCVAEQMVADPNFSTVMSPNPEDPEAFQLAIQQATSDDDLILANDPDADRVGAMVSCDGKWHRLTGNQIGFLLMDYYLQKQQALGKLSGTSAIITTIVSSPMIRKLAASYGIQTIETLTGFKWIWNAAQQLGNPKDFVFGMEESHGYLVGDYAGDKDGVWAAVAFAEALAALKKKGSDALKRLEALYQQFGYHLEALQTINFAGAQGNQQREALMMHFRNNPPHLLEADPLVRVVDLKKQIVTEVCSGETLPGMSLPQSDVLIFELQSGDRVIVRPSGTEPKIKYYFHLSGDDSQVLQTKLEALRTSLTKAMP